MLQLFCRWEGLIASEANRDHWDVAQLGEGTGYKRLVDL
jgi:hypothetical protein